MKNKNAENLRSLVTFQFLFKNKPLLRLSPLLSAEREFRPHSPIFIHKKVNALKRTNKSA